MRRKPLLASLILLLWGTPIQAQIGQHTINQREARKLVQGALVALGENARLVQIRPWPYYWAPGFYTFQAWLPGPGEGDSVLRPFFFAVNPWSGDVWDAMGCVRITSPAIEKEQELIWRRSRLPNEVRETIRNKAPGCSTNP